MIDTESATPLNAVQNQGLIEQAEKIRRQATRSTQRTTEAAQEIEDALRSG